MELYIFNVYFLLYVFMNSSIIFLNSLFFFILVDRGFEFCVLVLSSDVVLFFWSYWSTLYFFAELANVKILKCQNYLELYID